MKKNFLANTDKNNENIKMFYFGVTSDGNIGM